MNNSQRLFRLIELLHSYCKSEDDRDTVIDQIALMHRQGYEDEDVIQELAQALADGIRTGNWFWKSTYLQAGRHE